MGTVHARPELWDAFLQAGGNCFDTARHYGDESEGELGRFLERHGGPGLGRRRRQGGAPTRLPSGRRAARARPESRAAAHGPRRPPAAPPGRPGRPGRASSQTPWTPRSPPAGRARSASRTGRPERFEALQRVRAAPRSRTGGRALEPALARGDARAHVERAACAPTRTGTSARERLCSPGRPRRAGSSPAGPKTTSRPLVALGGEPRTSPARRGAR